MLGVIYVFCSVYPLVGYSKLLHAYSSCYNNMKIMSSNLRPSYKVVENLFLSIVLFFISTMFILPFIFRMSFIIIVNYCGIFIHLFFTIHTFITVGTLKSLFCTIDDDLVITITKNNRTNRTISAQGFSIH